MQDNKETLQRVIRVSEDTYNRLSGLGSVKDSFNGVIERLLNSYELHNSNFHSKSFPLLKEMVYFPENDDDKDNTLQLFEKILSLGDNVSYSLRNHKIYQPLIDQQLIEARKNIIIFFKDADPFCLVMTKTNGTSLLFPTRDKNTIISGWKEVFTLSSGVESAFRSIKRVYSDWKPLDL